MAVALRIAAEVTTLGAVDHYWVEVAGAAVVAVGVAAAVVDLVDLEVEAAVVVAQAAVGSGTFIFKLVN